MLVTKNLFKKRRTNNSANAGTGDEACLPREKNPREVTVYDVTGNLPCTHVHRTRTHHVIFQFEWS